MDHQGLSLLERVFRFPIENSCYHELPGVYYAFVKLAGKQFRRSLNPSALPVSWRSSERTRHRWLRGKKRFFRAIDL